MVSAVISARLQLCALERVLVSIRLVRITWGARDVSSSAPREVAVRRAAGPPPRERGLGGGPGVGGGQCRFGALIPADSTRFGVIFSEGELTQVR